jgi:acyl-CoA synthetase (AMP-forming)/AMP-acid ligase II
MTDLRERTERQQIVEALSGMVLAESPSLDPSAVHGSACLSDGLELDSLRLASLFATIRAEVGEASLVRWFLDASRAGRDTLDGLAEHLLTVLPQRGAWPPPSQPLALGPGAGHAPWRIARDAREAPDAEPGTPVVVPAYASISEALLERAREAPLSYAYVVVEPDGTQRPIRRMDLLEGARRAAGALRRKGVAPGDAVILCVDTSPALLATFYGCLLVGAVPALLEPPVGLARVAGWQERAAYALAATGSRLLVVDDHLHPAAIEVASRAGGAAVRAGELTVAPAPPLGSPRSTRGGQDLAYLQLTSGTTAAPRAVMVTHACLLANAAALGAASGWTDREVSVCWLPLHHDMGLVGTVLMPLLHGVPAVLLRPLSFLFAPSQWLWAIHHFRGTFSPAPNFAYELCARRIPEAELRGLDLGSWRLAYNGGEQVSAATLARFDARFAPHGFRPETMRPCYGMAECTLCATISVAGAPRVERIARLPLAETGRAEPSSDPQAVEVVSVGRPIAGFDVQIAGEDGAPLPERRQGEIWFRAPSVALGYLGDPDATLATFGGGWLRSGDLGYLAGGEIFVTGRRKDLIIRGGRNHAPYDLEAAAAGVAGVRAGCVAALGIASEERGTEEVVIVFETSLTERAGWPALEQAVIGRVFSVVGVRPDRAVAVPPRTLPKTSSGKLMRPWIRDRVASGAPFTTEPG